jgi:transposase-like protein
MDGSILACFEDPVVVGEIQDNTYNGNYRAYKDPQKGKIEVIGVPKVYKGTFERDLYVPKACGKD